MNDDIRKAAFELKRQREIIETARGMLEKGEYNPRLYDERDLYTLHKLELKLCDLVLAALEDEGNHEA